MSKIDDYQIAKNGHDVCAAWASMLGKTYYGGTSGKGAPGRLSYLKLSTADLCIPTIYYQYSDGAKNYHECPRELLPYLEAQITIRFEEILAAALAVQKKQLEGLAGAALAEHRALMESAGLSLPELSA